MIEEFCKWLAATPLSETFQVWTWFVPLVQTVHILSVAVVLTSVYMLSVRLVGFSKDRRPLAAITAASMPWIWMALGVLLLTGALLTITEPSRELLNNVFRAKMIMVLILVVILLVVQGRLRRNPGYWTDSSGGRRAARVLGSCALLLGAGIVTAGRWIAYV